MKLCDKIGWKGQTASASKSRLWDGKESRLVQQIQCTDFEGKDVLIIDDICVYGGTFKGLSKLLKERKPNIEGYVFTSNQNTVLSKQYVNRKLKEVFGSKSLAVSTHSLRKTFGRQVWSNNNETDKALLYLSELFNHSSPAITKRYLGIRQEELDDIYMSL